MNVLIQVHAGLHTTAGINRDVTKPENIRVSIRRMRILNLLFVKLRIWMRIVIQPQGNFTTPVF